MHAQQVLQAELRRACPEIHSTRFRVLMDTVHAVTYSRCLSVTGLGRALPATTTAKHNIKRVDRLTGNTHLDRESLALYTALSHWLIGATEHPPILVDWSDLTTDRAWQLLRASLPCGGRALTLYEEVHPLSQLANRQVHRRFLRALADVLPSDITPIVITDAGFRSTWFHQVEALGWHWLGRIRGRDLVRFGPDADWVSCREIMAQARARPQALGTVQIVRNRPTRCSLYRVRRAKKGRVSRTVFGVRARSRHSEMNARREREPWLLATSI